jgi:hypothetical protein
MAEGQKREIHMLKKSLFVLGFALALVAAVSPQSPYVQFGSDARAGLAECKQRCFEKYARCKAPGSACLDAKYECEKDCEASAK